MGGIFKISPIIPIMTLVLHGLTLRFRFHLEAESLRYGGDSNNSTDNHHLRRQLCRDMNLDLHERRERTIIPGGSEQVEWRSLLPTNDLSPSPGGIFVGNNSSDSSESSTSWDRILVRDWEDRCSVQPLQKRGRQPNLISIHSKES